METPMDLLLYDPELCSQTPLGLDLLEASCGSATWLTRWLLDVGVWAEIEALRR